jgi:hypothetical protein
MKARSAPTPQLSVVVVIFAGGKHILRCLETLACQEGMANVEILIPYDERSSGIPDLQGQFPTIRFLPVHGHCTYAQLRALGVREARGTIVALTEDHCIPERFWCARILEAHKGSHAAVGGVVEKQVPDTALNWALYLSDYGRYMSPMAEGTVDELTDCNVSYKRSALEVIADVWRNEFHEPIVHGALQARSKSLWLSPRIVVRQQRSLCLGEAIRDRYLFGRLFGSGRIIKRQGVKNEEQSIGSAWIRRLIYMGGAVFLPLLLVGRVAGHVLRKRRYGAAFVRGLPALVLLNTAWAWGEFVGYVTGRPAACLAPQAQIVSARSQVRAAT